MRQVLTKEIIPLQTIGVGTIQSDWIPVESFQEAGAQIFTTGTLVGAYTYLTSLDLIPTSDGGQNTYIINGVQYPRFFSVAIGAALPLGVTTVADPLSLLYATWVRLLITFSAGTGTVVSTLCAKSVKF